MHVYAITTTFGQIDTNPIHLFVEDHININAPSQVILTDDVTQSETFFSRNAAMEAVNILNACPDMKIRRRVMTLGVFEIVRVKHTAKITTCLI